MKSAITILFFIGITFPLISCGQDFGDRTVLGEQIAKAVIKRAINDKDYKPFYDILIKDNETAITVAEPILFNLYKKKNIIQEKPCECYLNDGYWCIRGTFPKDYKGGVFENLISINNGQVLKLTHGK